MKNRYYNSFFCLCILVFSIFVLFPGRAEATFSIVAVDTLTGAIGSAGMSCSNNVMIIQDIIEGVGAINTQSYYLAENQQNAHDRMLEGMTPDEIVAWLEANDAGGDPLIRQYVVVTLAGPGASAAYSGFFNFAWNGHTTGPCYAIAGNRLLGQEIVDTMEAAFLATDGPLEDKLFAALTAANIPGADNACLDCDKPAMSAFIRVIHPGDGATPYLSESVASTVCSVNPFDLLSDKYAAWKALKVADPDSSTIDVAPSRYFLAGFTDSATITVTPRNYMNNPPTEGAAVALSNSGEGVLSAVTDNGDGTFSAALEFLASPGVDTISASVSAGGQDIELTDRPVLYYLACGDVNADFNVNIGDAVYLITYIFKAGEPPVYEKAGDANCDGNLNIGDAVYLINFIFNSGPAPCSSCP